MRRIGQGLCLALLLGSCGVMPAKATTGPSGRIIAAGPADYLEWLARLQPGDTLQLVPGDYDGRDDVPGLPLFDLHGAPGKPIVIEGPHSGPPARLLARATHDTVRIGRASHLAIRYLELDGRNLDVDAVKAQGPSHHITLEYLRIVNHGHNQQTVGISTKAPAWNWVVRGNRIEGAGTGMYFGSPHGNWPFVAGLIERNLVVNTYGYNLQIKHQVEHPSDIGMPTESSVTVIRHNVFGKQHGASTGSMARPNLLVGHFPRRGPGRDDRYEIYGNFLYQNESGECLFQGEGNVAFYSNVLANDSGGGVCIQPHNDVPRDIAVFDNTILARTIGIRIIGLAPAGSLLVAGNVVFATLPFSGMAHGQNLVGTSDEAQRYLANPEMRLPGLDVRLKRASRVPRPDQLATGRFLGSAYDFDGMSRERGEIGAYARRDKVLWPLALEIKPKFVDVTLRR